MTSTQDFNCIFCKESFGNKEDLQIHFRKHGDPKFNQNVKSRLPNESQTSGEKANEDGEVVSCDVCSEVFTTISKAITHKHKVHPDHDAKYFCPWCGKLFTMKHLYNKHIQSSHTSEDNEGTGFHCDYCDVDFFAPTAMVYHNKFFHRQDTELAAIGQSRKLKMFNQEPLQVYYCPFCGEEYCNKVNLHKHMGDDHSDENQSPDDVLRCPLCDAIFYHLDAYEVHLTFHTSEDMYSEQNETLTDVTEFSLETVPPIMEKVENCDSQEDAEATMNSMGIETFLQQAMNESIENDNSNTDCVPEKRKKRKKHKKSKKAAITLDEFFNMNKDVFGEGIDFQGVEELPTRVVAKQLKKQPLKPKVARKVMPSTQLAKLKKQGIVVKMKPGKKMPVVHSMNVTKKSADNTLKVAQNVLPKDLTSVSHTKSDSISATRDVLSKLLNQSNSQLKIVKKSPQENSSPGLPGSADTSTVDKDANNSKVAINRLENELTDGEKMQKTEINITPATVLDEGQNDNQDPIFSDVKSTPPTLHPKLSQNVTEWSVMDTQPTNEEFMNEDEDEPPPDILNCSKESNYNDKLQLEGIHKKSTNTLSALRNIGQHITIKSMSSQNTHVIANQEQKLNKETDNNDVSEMEGDRLNVLDKTKNIQNNKELIGNNCIKTCSLNALKNLSNRVTVKSVNQPKEALPSLPKNITQHLSLKSLSSSNCAAMRQKSAHEEDVKEADEVDVTGDEDDDPYVSDETINSQNNKDSIKNSNSLNAIKHLSNLVTVKPVNKPKQALPSLPKNTRNLKSLSSPESTVKKQKSVLEEDNDVDMSDIEDDNPYVPDGTNQPQNIREGHGKNSNTSSVNAIKHLSNRVSVKSVNQSKLVSPRVQNRTDAEHTPDFQEDYHNEDMDEPSAVTEPPHDQKETSKSLAAFKNLSKHLTIKSLGQTLNSPKTTADLSFNTANDDGEHEEDNVHFGKKWNDNKQSHLRTPIKNTQLAIKTTNQIKSPEIRNHALNHSPKQINRSEPNSAQKNIDKVSDETFIKNQSCAKIMKQLPNVTAKTVNITRNMEQITSSVVKTLNQSTNIQKGNFEQKFIKKEEIKEDIEIFNIDDSDDEAVNSSPDVSKVVTSNKTILDNPQITERKNKPIDALKNLSKHITITPPNKQNPLEYESSTETLNDNHDPVFDDSEKHKSVGVMKNLSKHITVKPSNNQNPVACESSKEILSDKSNAVFDDSEKNRSIDVLRNLSRHITIKPPNKQNPLVCKSSVETLKDKDIDFFDDSENDMDIPEIKTKYNNHKPIDQKSKEFQNTLNNLAKHVTVKSGNASPNISIKSQGAHLKHNLDFDDFDSDSNCSSKRVQITELDDLNESEEQTKQNKTDNRQLDKNVFVQYPDESNSENEDSNDFHVPLNVESKIKFHKLQKPSPCPNQTSLEKLKNINKGLTIKTLKEDIASEDDEETACYENDRLSSQNDLSKNPIKSFSASRVDDSNITPANKNTTHLTQRMVNQSAVNQRVATSSGQVNTVNKEVSVKTFQTKTVIQEVTTTVTKTIRTVNQTVRQEVRNMNQTQSMPMMRPQKIQGIRPTQHTPNYQGIVVRQTAPPPGPRMRNAAPPYKSSVGGAIRPSNQLVPVRPTISQIRPNSPRMPAPKKVLSASNPRQPTVGRPLKISPNAMIASTTKRGMTVDSSGPFSCFKKQKESLIPVPDLPDFDTSQGGESSVQYTSSSHMSKCNFTNATNTVKGNSVVTSMQMKSEVSTSSQQLNRLNTMSGLKVVKTSQAKQTVVEEKSEISASKRSALQAIEKLQKHGLLVKKPRVDEDNYSEHSNSDGDDDVGT